MSDIFEFTKISDKAKSIGNEILKEVLDTRTYNANKISEWIDSINATIISRLKEMSPNFKYIVSSSIIQKVGAGIHLETSTYWDTSTDGVIMVKFENDSLISTCSIYGIGL